MAAKNHDAYIAAAPEYARPILEKLRKAVHAAVPGVEESIKWSAPCFDHYGILCGMAAFKQHVALRMWYGMQLSETKIPFEGVGNTQMGTLKVSSLKELPPAAALKAMLKEAAKLNESRASKPKAAKAANSTKSATKKPKKPASKLPADLAQALAKFRAARTFFEGLAPGYQAEYVEWITEAKREATRAKRLATTLEWLGEGKTRNWKYR